MFVAYPHVSTAMRLLPPVVVDVLREHAGLAVVAGGFLRAISMGNHPKSDVDIFFPGGSPSQRIETLVSCMRLLHARSSRIARANGIVVTDNAVTIDIGSHPVQLVRGFDLPNAQEILGAFDFTISKAALWIDANVARTPVGTCDVTFLRDIGTRSIVYDCQRRVIAPILSAKRVEKFLRQGFTLRTEDLVTYIEACLATQFSTIDGSSKYDEVNHTNSSARMFHHVADAEAFVRSGAVITQVDPSIDTQTAGGARLSIGQSIEQMIDSTPLTVPNERTPRYVYRGPVFDPRPRPAGG